MADAPPDDDAPTDDGLARVPPAVAPRVKRLILALVAITGGAGLLGTALSPYLLVEHPLLLVGLNPDSRHLVLAAGGTDLWHVVAVGAPRRALNFVATYGLASLYGYLAVRWIEERHPWLKKVVRLFEGLYRRLGVWLVVLVPLYSVAGLAGSSRMPFGRYLVAIVPGQVAFVAGVSLFGSSVAAWTTPIVAFLSAHLVEATGVACVIVGIQVVYRRRRGVRRDTVV